MNDESLAPLIEFIGRRFDQVDQRFEAMDQRFESIDQRFEAMDQRFEAIDRRLVETRRHFDVVAEDMQSKIQLVAESVATVQDEARRFQASVTSEFAETRVAIRFSYAQLERRIQELEGNYASLHDRLGRLEARFGQG